MIDPSALRAQIAAHLFELLFGNLAARIALLENLVGAGIRSA